MNPGITISDGHLRAIALEVAEILQQRKQMLALAESCTGGWIGKVLTDIPGCSEWFVGGAVAYAYEAKEAWLGVQAHTLEAYGAVSHETASEMVAGALARFGGSIAVAVTGIAGPGGGTPDKPVGTVWIAWKQRGGYAQCELCHFDGDREAVRRQTVAYALHGIRKILTD
ncbi:MAG TPA: CinA family protein [Rhodanobacteraceae bacterium]|nr:CinA family protein [Rhodanobacteraceae bacterium]